MIHYERVPCWYELSWRQRKGIVLRIHKDFANSVKPVSTDAPIINHFKMEFGFTEFSGQFGKDFGFQNSLKFLGMSKGFLEYLIPTPLVRKLTSRTCRYCKGTGRDNNIDGKCLSCSGERKETVYDYAEAFAISASLSTLLDMMRFPDIETTSDLPQLICLQTVAIRDAHGGSLSGEFSRDTASWLRQRGLGEIPEMVSAMRAVWKKMDGRIQDFYKYSFRASISSNNGWLCVDCPGDACGLHPSSGYMEKDRGFEFSCHNTDTSMQQLVLIASLASLHDLVRKGTE